MLWLHLLGLSFGCCFLLVFVSALFFCLLHSPQVELLLSLSPFFERVAKPWRSKGGSANVGNGDMPFGMSGFAKMLARIRPGCPLYSGIGGATLPRGGGAGAASLLAAG